MSPFEAGIKESESFEATYLQPTVPVHDGILFSVCFDAWSLATNKISRSKKHIWKISLNDFHMAIPDAQHVSM